MALKIKQIQANQIPSTG